MDFLEYYKPPFTYESYSQRVLCADGMALDVRGWGRLTGGGALALPADKAMKIQDDFGRWVAETLNKASEG